MPILRAIIPMKSIFLPRCRGREKKMRINYDTQRIEQARHAYGLTRGELVKKAGITYPTLRLFMQGKAQTPQTARKIARALGLDLAELVVTTAA